MSAASAAPTDMNLVRRSLELGALCPNCAPPVTLANGLASGSEKFPDSFQLDIGGEGGIRTPDTLASMPHFECGAFNHSATSPLSGSSEGAEPSDEPWIAQVRPAVRVPPAAEFSCGAINFAMQREPSLRRRISPDSQGLFGPSGDLGDK